ncbi:Aste57867_1593 [Aphanomyces stellatus]|uniref:Aste57867_1593 protein n=1 Tax=Aphanomyces stellatus TaxID=120398 RepID=A0A485K917_9STRA|nr:hypothetical protein As57867_001592 [Aphanomyces stellatus]VFT78806.1 Aste57867_1593 [Aphanomyces stellatus]
MLVKEGKLFKKGSGEGPLQRKNWKPRYVRLTPEALEYYCMHSGQLKGSLDLRQCGVASLEVMPTDCVKTGTSESSTWRLAINAPTRRFLVAAESEMEMNEWAFALLDVFKGNDGRLYPY